MYLDLAVFEQELLSIEDVPKNDYKCWCCI